MTIDVMQRQINRLAYNTFKNAQGFSNFSVPHIPRISPQYLKNRFVLMGEETRTWYPDKGLFDSFINCNPANDEQLEKILQIDRYDAFCMKNAATYKWPFWEFTRKLYEEKIIKEPLLQNKYLGHCWMNFYTIENCYYLSKKGCPSQDLTLGFDVIDKAQKCLVFEILKIIKPKCILATIHSRNDDYFNQFALGVSDYDLLEQISVDSDDIITKEMMKEIKIIDPNHPLYGTKIIKTFHPKHFRGTINDERRYKDEKKKLKAKHPGLKMSQYYEQVLLEKLRQIV
jgi:hypothetical protein